MKPFCLLRIFEGRWPWKIVSIRANCIVIDINMQTNSFPENEPSIFHRVLERQMSYLNSLLRERQSVGRIKWMARELCPTGGIRDRLSIPFDAFLGIDENSTSNRIFNGMRWHLCEIQKEHQHTEKRWLFAITLSNDGNWSINKSVHQGLTHVRVLGYQNGAIWWKAEIWFPVKTLWLFSVVLDLQGNANPWTHAEGRVIRAVIFHAFGSFRKFSRTIS